MAKHKKYIDPADGKEYKLKDLAAKYNIRYFELWKRLDRGLSVTDALSLTTEENLTNHPLYQIYYGILIRCYRDNDSAYPLYGGRGIRVCSRWLEPFGLGLKNFYTDMGDRVGNQQIDRIDVNGDYSPENCRWVTPQQNLMNRRVFKKNKTGFKGVSIRPSGKFRAAIAKDKKDYVIGQKFETAEDAARAYDAKAIELFGEFAVLNFPEKA